MGQLGKYLRRLTGGYAHWCPGCEEMHYISASDPQSKRPQWSFNGDIENPTFSPSMKLSKKGVVHCHYFLRDGKLQFLRDCTHDFAGKTIPLPELPKFMRDDKNE